VADAKIGLTIYLLKPDRVAAFEADVKPGNTVRALAAPLDGEFIQLPSTIGEPIWADAVRGAVQNSAGLNFDSQSAAGLLVVRRGANTFVVSFGHAWQKLEYQWLQVDFGLRVALNSIPRNKVIELRAEQVFAKWHVASERAPRASFVEEFGVEFDRDFIGFMEGEAGHAVLGKTIRGGTNLRVKAEFSRLGMVLDRAGTLFQSTQYRKRWPEVGNVKPVNDPATISGLEAQLNTDLADKQAVKRIVLFTPAERREGDSQLADSYVYGRMSKNPVTRPHLRIESWLSYLQENATPPTVQAAQETPIHLLDEDNEGFKTYSVFDCFGYELAYSGVPYVLSSGTWYEVLSDFVDQVNRYVHGIEKPTVQLPSWNEVESEAEFNARCGNASGFLHFDSADVIFGGGPSRFEFCDFLHQKSKTLFFAKVGARSSGMSHLVEQVRRTAELLFNVDGAYRVELAKVFRRYHPSVDASWLKSRPNNSDWKLCLISLGRTARSLPFFAKCALYRVHKGLTERGHKVYFGSV
jgi:uncharacterized protein (TIGR04141 family)